MSDTQKTFTIPARASEASLFFLGALHTEQPHSLLRSRFNSLRERVQLLREMYPALTLRDARDLVTFSWNIYQT
jgi:hypothetical protein